tara:strand:- start:16895 stop:18445 length:1551 start_codon:yes stop_codon:yes gene_type:complete
MTMQIIQVPTDTSTTWTGTGNIKDTLIPTNHTPILPIVVQQTDDISSFFKVKFICRVYQNSISDDNLLCVLKQRPNAFATTTNSVSMFDIRGIVNSVLQYTYQDISSTGGLPEQDESIHNLGVNDTDHIYSQNDGNVRLVYVSINWEYATSSTSPAIEQSTASDVVTFGTRYCQATFPLFNNNMSTNYLADYLTSSSGDPVFSDVSITKETRYKYLAPGGTTGILEGRINYIDPYNDAHTIFFGNKAGGWLSDGEFLIIKYYDKEGTKIGGYTWAIANTSTQGGEDPDTANASPEYLLYAGVGTLNLNNYNGDAIRNSVAEANFSGEPNGANTTGWKYYEIYMASNNTGVTRKSQSYYFVADPKSLANSQANCKGQKIIRLAWINSVGGWDYYNFNGGQTETLSTERNKFQSILGSNTLDTNNKYYYNSWEGGEKVFSVKTKRKSTLSTQFISEAEGDFLENLFNSPSVMIMGKDITTQRVIVVNTEIEKQTSAKKKIEIQYTFEIQYSNNENVNI